MTEKQRAIDYSKTYQRHIVAMILRVPGFLASVRECIFSEHFDDPAVNDILAWTLRAYDEAKEVPSRAMLADTFEDHVGLLRNLYREDVGDARLTAERIRHFARNRQMRVALVQAANYVNGETRGDVPWDENIRGLGISKAQWGNLPNLDRQDALIRLSLRMIDKAKQIGNAEPVVTHDVFKDFPGLLRSATAGKDTDLISTGHPHLDEAGLGGCPGEVGGIMGVTGGGKTHMAWSLALQMARLGHRVYFYSVEMRGQRMAQRVCSRIAGKKADLGGDKDEFVRKASARLGLFLREPNRLLIEYGISKRSSINSIRARLLALREQGFVPEVVIIDYPGILQAEEKYAEVRHRLEDIWLGFRGLCQEFRVLGWGPIQSNREALRKMINSTRPEILTAADIGECYAIVQHLDLGFAICQTQVETEANRGRFYVFKNRYGKHGTVIDFECDLARGIFSTTGLSRPQVLTKKVRSNRAEDEAFKDAVDRRHRDHGQGP